MKAITSSAEVAAQEKRRERRYPTNDSAQVKVFPYTQAPIPANIVDVSRSGMKLELARPLSREAKIEVLMPLTKLVVFGTTLGC